MPVDILFINPGNQRKTYQELSRELTAIATPVWTCLLAQYARNRGHAVAIYDVNVDGWQDGSAKAVIERFKPRLVVMMVYGHNPSASTQTMPAAGRIARSIKTYNPDIPVALGGIHPSALPERTLAQEAADYVIIGEGPYTVDGLLDVLKGRINIPEVKGLAYKDADGSAVINAAAPLVADLNAELDGYAWDLLPGLDKYRAHTMHCFQDFNRSRKEDFFDVRSPYVTLNTSLGCPFSCAYCCINAVFQKPGIRYWSLDKVAGWIDVLHGKYGVRNIRFDDELFILSPERIERFCDIIIERKYDLNIWVYGRIDTIRESLLAKMKLAGITWICLGIESGNEAVRSGVQKNIRADISETVRKIKRSGINTFGNYMFGLPDDDRATMEETLRLALDLNCEFANFYSVMAYPGSRLYQEHSGRPGSLPDNWEGYAQLGYQTRPLATKYLSSAEVLRFRDDAFNRYFTDPAYLKLVGEKFGQKVISHIEQMLQVRLKRQILGE
jgi:anaerobic magnesium-protoporphyrin IX monomethyl ester cyclase